MDQEPLLLIPGNAKCSAPMPNDGDNDVVKVEEPAPKKQKTRSSQAKSSWNVGLYIHLALQG
jgi:hypothetical protein